MIYKIEIENFYSIRDRQVLDLRVPANAPRGDHRLADCWTGSTERAPKVVAIFGANGSGKSNLLRAVSFANWFVSSSFALPAGARLPYEPFDEDPTPGNPTRLKLWSSWLDDPGAIGQNGAPECPYCYELVIGNNGHCRVMGESIFHWPASTRRKKRLFERFEDGTVTASRSFGLAGYKGPLEKILRPNASVVSTLAQLNHPIAQAIAEAAADVQSNILTKPADLLEEGAALRRYIEDPGLVERLNDEIGRFDFGFRSLEIRQEGDRLQAWFWHDDLPHPLHSAFESHGIRQFVKMYPLIAGSLARGGIVVIDEMDLAIHPMVLSEVIDWFRDPVRNPKNAQLWISCHDASLLDELTKDEIAFCHKKRRGRTEIFGLSDIKGVRRDENYYRNYLGGVFGAVPPVG